MKDEQDRELSRELEMTFPASDPPASTEPGGGVTGPEAAGRLPAGRGGARRQSERALDSQALVALYGRYQGYALAGARQTRRPGGVTRFCPDG